MKWWAQSFLIGIPKIVCGFRDNEGIVQHLQTFKTVDIPRESQVTFAGRTTFALCIYTSHLVSSSCNLNPFLFRVTLVSGKVMSASTFLTSY